jgi:ubiquinone/menaquinone biosynthesis C-methylase UbiE
MASDEIERWSPFKVWLYSLLGRNPKSNLGAVDRLRLDAGDRFLDIGCGLGAAIEHASKTGAAVAGVDPSPSMVERASRRVPEAEVKVGSAESIPFPDDRFTAVLGVATFHHWARPEEGLREVLRVLAPGGRLMIVERRVKGAKGHGLSPSDAESLAGKLAELGMVSGLVEPMRLGRVEFLAVSATKPEAKPG